MLHDILKFIKLIEMQKRDQFNIDTSLSSSKLNGITFLSFTKLFLKLPLIIGIT